MHFTKTNVNLFPFVLYAFFQSFKLPPNQSKNSFEIQKGCVEV